MKKITKFRGKRTVTLVFGDESRVGLADQVVTVVTWRIPIGGNTASQRHSACTDPEQIGLTVEFDSITFGFESLCHAVA